ncbi:hypothetical protein INT45_006551 [Circinella minor]|uniref:Pentacotripeptide-repeat region of PRORP domain-containing protein n=1 Tax=Circinella minor TaxID=1195481 RepID=A0A8H7S1A2_9FUNG|nr:hypothetical protein INT45_006551 [Circinella minor]
MNSLRLSQRICIQRGQLLIRMRNTQCARFGTSRRHWFFRRFLSPKEEQKLYLGLTAAFRQKLDIQSNESTKSYSNIIEQVILTSNPSSSTHSHTNKKSTKIIPTPSQLDQLKQSLDSTTDKATLFKLEQELNQYQLNSVALYNRLIRSYIRGGYLDEAEKVFKDLKHLMPTTRTFTYLIQANVKLGRMEKAKDYVEKMQYLDLRLRTAFDCQVVLKYYVQADKTHAVDILWQHIVQHNDIIKPGWSLYTMYMEWLIRQKQQHQEEEGTTTTTTQSQLANVVQNAVQLLEHKPTIQQARIVAQAAEIFNTSHPDTADRALLLVARTAPKYIHKKTVDPILCTYLKNGKTLKAAALYYFLRKAHVPNESIGHNETLSKLKKALKQQDISSSSLEHEHSILSTTDLSPSYYH